ncbi:adenylate/guanylate cyclase domain-containing protein [Methylobacterium nodulans]|nr:adenylate/guanylate cyclase domain-containing protein [Methylobacterium nodulans]
MHDSDALLDALRQAGDPEAVQALEQLIQHGADEELVRINALSFAGEHGLSQDAVISTLLHGARLGLFEMSWNILCSSCGGVLGANASLKSVRQDAYRCAFCALDTEPILDDAVEVSFAISPRIRRVAAHDPGSLAFWDYHRQIFFGTGVVFPEPPAFEDLARLATLEAVELQAGERMILALQIPAGSLILFDPVTHTAQVLDVAGEPAQQRQELSLVFDDIRPAVGHVDLKPGQLRLTLENRSEERVLPGIFIAGEALNTLIGGRRPFLTAKRLLSNQAFRDIYRTDALDVDQRLKILSLTFVFTDLTGSTDLYERVGDLVAYDLVRSHFQILTAVVASHGGAVVKTIGDAVMATFPMPSQAVAAALEMREAMRRLNTGRETDELILKIGLHEGPCLAVLLNDRQDYFGQTVNIAARVQELATSGAIFVSEPVVRHAEAARLLTEKGLQAQRHLCSLRGIGSRMPVFELT